MHESVTKHPFENKCMGLYERGYWSPETGEQPGIFDWNWVLVKTNQEAAEQAKE